MVVNLLLISALSLGSGSVQTFPQFLPVRSLFGIGMGGVWGLASATALENLPVEARGLASGFIQQDTLLDPSSPPSSTCTPPHKPPGVRCFGPLLVSPLSPPRFELFFLRVKSSRSTRGGS